MGVNVLQGGVFPAASGSEVPPEVLAVRARAQLLVPEAAVEQALDRLALRLSERLAGANPWLLAVMQGGMQAAAALAGRLSFPLQLGHLHVGRCGGGADGGQLRWHATPTCDVRGRTVLIVDDVLQRGHTIARLAHWARRAGASQVVTAVLVDRQVSGIRCMGADFSALECPDRDLFGWGMDYRGYWRNLRDIYAVPEDLPQP